MIKNVQVKGFKCFADEIVEFSNLTIVTGPNSSGKSSLIQAVLFSIDYSLELQNGELKGYLSSLGEYSDLKNRVLNSEDITIQVCFSEYDDCILYNRDLQGVTVKYPHKYQANFSYLNAQREPVTETQSKLRNEELSIYGYNTIGYYELNKQQIISDNFNYSVFDKCPDSNTLDSHLNFWISYITEQHLDFYVEKITSTLFRSYYKIGTQEYKPFNLGAGVGYLVAVITKALLMKEKEIFIIENPEIHLHPKSQARLAEFFAFVARTGRQIIIETHSEHLISKLRYCVYKKQIESPQVVIQYRQPDKFEKIEILTSGKLLNKTGDHSFPRGFFDATLDDIFEINSNV